MTTNDHSLPLLLNPSSPFFYLLYSTQEVKLNRNLSKLVVLCMFSVYTFDDGIQLHFPAFNVAQSAKAIRKKLYFIPIFTTFFTIYPLTHFNCGILIKNCGNTYIHIYMHTYKSELK